MRKLLALILTSLLAVGCAVTSEGLRRDGAALQLIEQFETLEEAEDAADAAVAAAQESGDPEALADAQAAADIIKTELRELETSVLRERGGLIGDMLVAFTGPAGVPIKTALLSLAPLLGRRGRRHYARAVKQLNPFGGDASDPSVSQASAPLQAALDLLRAWGFLHSNKASAAAAEEPSPEA